MSLSCLHHLSRMSLGHLYGPSQALPWFLPGFCFSSLLGCNPQSFLVEGKPLYFKGKHVIKTSQSEQARISWSEKNKGQNKHSEVQLAQKRSWQRGQQIKSPEDITLVSDCSRARTNFSQFPDAGWVSLICIRKQSLDSLTHFEILCSHGLLTCRSVSKYCEYHIPLPLLYHKQFENRNNANSLLFVQWKENNLNQNILSVSAARWIFSNGSYCSLEAIFFKKIHKTNI